MLTSHIKDIKNSILANHIKDIKRFIQLDTFKRMLIEYIYPIKQIISFISKSNDVQSKCNILEYSDVEKLKEMFAKPTSFTKNKNKKFIKTKIASNINNHIDIMDPYIVYSLQATHA